ncbi:MAG: hypothetical protein RL338_305 [Chloroflexota bacterium]|jgi:RNA polymerase subunit RPABC4/transcription elongation factor Spt4
MADIIDGITGAIGGFLGSPIVQLGIRAFAIYWVVLWLASAYWAFRDLQLRTDNAVLPYVAAAVIVVFTPILFPAAVLLYRLIRPQERTDDVYERTLAQEALLAEVDASGSCPRCRRRVRDDWIACPSCRVRLSRPCPGCSRLVATDWLLCAWCGRDLGERASESAPAGSEATAGGPAAAGRAPSSATAPSKQPSASAATGSLPER